MRYSLNTLGYAARVGQRDVPWMRDPRGERKGLGGKYHHGKKERKKGINFEAGWGMATLRRQWQAGMEAWAWG
jgi:hypothetical protein